MKQNEPMSLDAQLQAAYKRYRTATDRVVQKQNEWGATRTFLGLVLTCHNAIGYTGFKRKLKTLLGISSNSRVDEYLSAARFASAEFPTGPNSKIRILDLGQTVRCPTVSQMAKANSFIISKDKKKQVLGREFLYQAIRGECLPSVAEMKHAANNRRFSYSITAVSTTPDWFMMNIAYFLGDMAASGDKFALECLRGLRNAVAAGGDVELQLSGVYKTKIAANESLAKEMFSVTDDTRSQSITLSDAKETALIQEWILHGNTTPVDRGKNIEALIQPKTFRERREEARKERSQIKTERSDMISWATGGAPGRILTGNVTREEMIQWISTGWEGPDDLVFPIADIVSENIYDAEKHVKESLKLLSGSLHEKRIGVIIFPREPLGWVEERLLADAIAQSTTERADQQSPPINSAELAKELHSSNPDLPLMAAETAVKDAIIRLRRKLKREPGPKEILLEGEHDIAWLMVKIGCAANLETVVQKLREFFPHLPRTTANAMAANASKKLKDKYGINPDEATIFHQAQLTLKSK